ncbi:MAG: hypothetical protein IK088_02090, partial [Lachnospiraceae bacterium]|nr:hypothetical protein [Lachnospiraceae bacterium]
DNGAGMSKEEIEALYKGEHFSDPHDTEHNGIGMDNVISRLRLFAGIDDVIEMISEGKDKGLEVIIGWELLSDEKQEEKE